MAEGPESELTLTENAQPALMAVSMAALRAIEREGNTSLARLATVVAGHSLGEYSADAARLLKRRGRAMQTAVPVGEGAMAALMGMELDAARAVAEEASKATGLVCDVANDNAPGQVVVSGAAAAVDKAVELAAARGGRRSIKLPVSAPFHCRLMQPAADEMAKALSEVAVAVPVVPVVANVAAAPADDPDTIRRLLVEQVTGTVRWRECDGDEGGRRDDAGRMRRRPRAHRPGTPDRQGPAGDLGRHAARGRSAAQVALGAR
jgi:[acyl-carrier-protein] S-malonyltransferase